MADITKCTGTNCPEQTQCKRYTASSSDRQSYFATPPLQPDGTCDMYWGINQVSIMDELNEIVKGEKK